MGNIKSEGYEGEAIVTQEIDMRYLGQNYELSIGLPNKDILNEKDMEEIYDDFHKKHEERYGYSGLEFR